MEDLDPELHPAIKNITPKAGDVIVLSELTTHGVLIWKPKDRDRRFLLLRYKTQYFQDYRGKDTFMVRNCWTNYPRKRWN